MNRVAFLKELKQHGIQNNIPNISLENACFLRGILREKQVKNMLEIGTANGYSTIHFACEIEKWWGHITTVDFSELAHKAAVENFKAAEVSDSISAYHGDARDLIPTFECSYDFVFIDGLKKRSKVFLELVWEKLEEWGIIVIDDVIKFRHKMEDLYTYVDQQQLTYNILPIDEDDGIMMIIK